MKIALSKSISWNLHEKKYLKNISNLEHKKIRKWKFIFVHFVSQLWRGSCERVNRQLINSPCILERVSEWIAEEKRWGEREIRDEKNGKNTHWKNGNCKVHFLHSRRRPSERTSLWHTFFRPAESALRFLSNYGEWRRRRRRHEKLAGGGNVDNDKHSERIFI